MEGCETVMIYEIIKIILIVFSSMLGWMLSKTYISPRINDMDSKQKIMFLFIMIMALFFSLKFMFSVI